MSRTFVQIALAGHEENRYTEGEFTVIALASDGTVWAATNRDCQWFQWPGLPEVQP